MTREEIIRRLENISSHAVHTIEEESFIMSLDDGIAIKMAIKALEQEPFDIETYCKEHFCVMVDKDVWEKAEKALKQESCEDAISRQAALSMQYRIDDSVTLSTRDIVNVDDIEDLPPVTPQPKTGYWVEETINGGGRKVFCSECGCPPPFEHISTGDVYSANGYGVINKTKFCPNCGIKMEREET